MSAQQQKHIVDYFRRGQVLFLVDGDEWNIETSPQQVIDWASPVTALTNFRSVNFPSVDDLIGGQGTPGTQEPGEPQETPPLEVAGPVLSLEKSEGKKPYTSPIVNPQGRFSLVFADVPSLKEIPEIDRKDRDKWTTRLSQDDLELLNLTRSLDEIRDTFPIGRLQVVSPNWLVSGGKSEPGGTGGPGSRPTPYAGSADNQDYKIRANGGGAWLEGILNIPEEQRGAGVVVAILDTAPTTEIASPESGETWVMKRADNTGSFLDSMYDQWVTQRQTNPPNDPHRFIERLLPRLTVYLNPNVDRPDPTVEPDGYIQEDKHDYYMTDHGLFVAGLIHSLAPQADLHLYQVLSRYGVGDLENIADALLDVYTKFAGKRLVVNLSLTINVPLEKDHTGDDEEDEVGNSLLTYKEKEEGDPNSWSERLKSPAERICDLAYQLRSRIIAAAGNNRKGLQSGRPQACLPAALDSVLGVGALPKKKNPPADPKQKLDTTTYSNRSDSPNYVGITTLGGEGGKEKGVLGLYVADFPEKQADDKGGADKKGPSQNGWAWWAGTSFATPIISGLTAAVLADSPPEQTTEDAILKLFAAQLLETKDNEDVLFVTQGP